MKYIKTFEIKKIDSNKIESLFDKLTQGTFVTIKPNDDFSESYNNFVKNHIAKIDNVLGNFIYVRFLFNNDDSESIKNEFNHVKAIRMDNVDLYSPTLKELEIKIKSNKFNL